jgi:hypothetical protein
MTITSHNVEVPFPQAFATRKSSPFPCAPRYGRELLIISLSSEAQTARYVCALAKHSKNFTLLQRGFLCVTTLFLS